MTCLSAASLFSSALSSITSLSCLPEEYQKFEGIDFAQKSELVSTLISERGIKFNKMPPAIVKNLEKAKNAIRFLYIESPSAKNGKRPPETQTMICSAEIKFLASFFPQIQALTFRGFVFSKNSCKAIRNWTQLTELDLSFSIGFKVKHLSAAVQKLALKKLNVSYTRFDDSAAFLPNSCPNLTSLNFEGCEKITEKTVTAFLNTLKSLEEMNAKGCVKVKQTVIYDWVEFHPETTRVTLPDGRVVGGKIETVAQIFSQRTSTPSPTPRPIALRPQLEPQKVEPLEESKREVRPTQVSFLGIQVTKEKVLASNLREVETLCFSNCVFEPDCLEQLRELKNLKSLTIIHSEGVEYDQLPLLAQCPQLTTLEIVNVATTNMVISWVLVGCTGLQKLTIRNCEGIKKERIQIYLPWKISVPEQEKLLAKVEILKS